MISRKLKSVYYRLFGWPMFINGRLYKLLRAPDTANANVVKVQLGPGQACYLDGWINLDANILTARCDVWCNLEDPLPFKPGSVDVFYSHHVIEHLPDQHLVDHFRQMHLVLKPGGLIRIGGPNADMAVQKYLSGDASWFGDFPDKHSSIGGKLKNFVFCRNEHLTMLTPSYLHEIVTEAGFNHGTICIPGMSTTRPDLIDASVLQLEKWSSPTEPHTIVIECEKRQ